MPSLGPLKLNRCPERLLNLVCFSEIFQMFLVGNFINRYILHKVNIRPTIMANNELCTAWPVPTSKLQKFKWMYHHLAYVEQQI